MAIFLDTGIFVAAMNSRDSNHSRGSEIFEQSLKGDFGAVFTSDYVVDEAVTTALSRAGSFEAALNVGKLAIDSPRVELLFTGSEEFSAAWAKFQKLGKKPLSFTDCVSLAHMEKHGVTKIGSFDPGFDGLATRVH